MVRMLRPPKFAWFPATRDQIPEYTSAGGRQKYDKKIDKINRINSIFDKLNKPNWASVGFQLMGLTRLTIHTKTDAAGKKFKQYNHHLSRSGGSTARRVLHNVFI